VKSSAIRKIILVGVFFILLQFQAFQARNPEDFSHSEITDEINAKLSVIKRDIISCAPISDKSKPGFSFLDSLEEIFSNDNRKPAGHLKDGVLYLNLEARTGIWYPETHDGSGLRVHAFAEESKPLQLPGPLIRVAEGTEIRATIRNLIVGLPLVLHGFFARPGNPRDSVVIPYGQTYKVQFKAGVAGTYFYKASAGNLLDDGLPYFDDSQLYGAYIIDPVNKKPDPQERIMMIGVWDDTLNYGTAANEEYVINGLTWPYTERLTYTIGQEVHWRVINASGGGHVHPMHLHGFYFTITSKGNVNRDSIYKKQYRRKVVTELLKLGETMSISWIPEREGNWLFHCHTLLHILPGSFLRNMPAMDGEHMNNLSTHALDGMGGLIMGIHVLPSGVLSKKNNNSIVHERNLTLIAREQFVSTDTFARNGFVLFEGNVSSLSQQISIPGPTIILTRGEPVAIKIINRLREPTTVHWHGLEIDSYFDGVAGWGNRGKELSPLIMPGDSFIVHMTPPRAGTFIYHTHMHNFQLTAGMYGPLIVTEPGKKFDSETNKILLISNSGTIDSNSCFVLLNGTDKPGSMQLKVGMKYRLRLINIMAFSARYTVSFLFNKNPISWRAIAKDGADLPLQQVIMIPASAQTMTIGETRDFEFQPKEKGNYTFEVHDGDGKLCVVMLVQVK
jgi:manganese oxidase